jgi:hypothetical protein
VAEIAEGLRGYAAAGVGHVICSLDPVSEEAIAKLAEAWKLAQA